MMNTEIRFPALVLGKASIDKINYQYFSGNKKYANVGYKDVSIVDRDGNYFKVKGTKQIGGISLIDSIKNFDRLVKIEPILSEPIRKISLDECKKIMIDVIKRYPHKFSNLDSSESLITTINGSRSIQELIDAF